MSIFNFASRIKSSYSKSIELFNLGLKTLKIEANIQVNGIIKIISLLSLFFILFISFIISTFFIIDNALDVSLKIKIFSAITIISLILIILVLISINNIINNLKKSLAITMENFKENNECIKNTISSDHKKETLKITNEKN